MPLPTLLCIAFASGIASAVAGRAELRVSPRPPLLTRSFAAFAIFELLLLVPVAVYFYVFHGDWFLLYTVDVRTVPSAIALLGFLVMVALGAAGFAAGAALVRSQRETIAGALVGLFLLASGGVALLAQDRLSMVGSYAQYTGGFGLTPYGTGPLVQGTFLMATLLLSGLSYLLVRLYLVGRRG